MLGDIGLQNWKKFKMSEEDRKDPPKVLKKFRVSWGMISHSVLPEAHCIETPSREPIKPYMN